MESCRCEAIVLGVTDYRESDRLVTLFTGELGRVKGVARGAKRSMRRFGGALELFARIRAELVSGEGLSRVLGADVVSVFPGIRRDLVKIALAGYACELVELLVPEALPQPRLFRLLTAYLEQLDREASSPSDRRFFEVNLANILGYRPALEECGSCGAPLADCEHLFLGAPGSLLCERCRRGGRKLSAATVQLLRRALATGRFGAIRFSRQEAAEAGDFLDLLISAHLPRPLKSLAFLREMEAIGGTSEES
ncbi:MAG TPA: DNA repair protein RecO [Geobacteraceae bacterium]